MLGFLFGTFLVLMGLLAAPGPQAERFVAHDAPATPGVDKKAGLAALSSLLGDLSTTPAKGAAAPPPHADGATSPDTTTAAEPRVVAMGEETTHRSGGAGDAGMEGAQAVEVEEIVPVMAAPKGRTAPGTQLTGAGKTAKKAKKRKKRKKRSHGETEDDSWMRDIDLAPVQNGAVDFVLDFDADLDTHTVDMYVHKPPCTPCAAIGAAIGAWCPTYGPRVADPAGLSADRARPHPWRQWQTSWRRPMIGRWEPSTRHCRTWRMPTRSWMRKKPKKALAPPRCAFGQPASKCSRTAGMLRSCIGC